MLSCQWFNYLRRMLDVLVTVMKSFLPPLVAVFALVSQIFVEAAEPVKAPAIREANDASWVTRSFRMKSDMLSIPAEKDQPESRLEFPDAPAADAPAEVWIQHIKDSTVILRKYFAQLGLNLPEGTAFAADRKSWTYAVRTPQNYFAAIEANSAGDMSRVPTHLVFQLHIVQADAKELRDVVKYSQTHADLTNEWKRLRGLPNKNQTRILHSARLETRSGQRASIAAGAQHEHANGFKIDAQGRIEWKRETTQTGLQFEIEPVIGPDGTTVDINFDLTYHYAPPTERMALAGEAGPFGKIEVPVTDYHRAKVQTAMTFVDGMTRLIGVWRPEGVAELDKQDVLQAAFLEVKCVKLMPAENKTLTSMLEKYADKAEPMPADKSDKSHAAENLPAGMQRRTFKVPPDFVTLDPPPGESPVPDPFAASNVSRPRCKLPKEILQGYGIEFPEGSRAIFNANLCELIVINTPQNLDAVEAFTDWHSCYSPHGLVQTVHIIQADAATLRQLSDETSGISDHTDALRKLEELVAQGKAKFVSTQRIETRSGGRALLEAGTDRMEVTKLRKSNPNGEMTAAVEGQLSGTKLEIEPLMCPDGYTIDVNIALDHCFVASSTHRQGGKGAGSTKQLEIETTKTHAAKIMLATTYWTGASRLLALWKPEGLPTEKGADVLQAAFLCVDRLLIEKADVAASKDK